MSDAIIKLKKRLDSVETKLFDISIELSKSKATTNYYWSQMTRRIKEVYEEARIIFSDWSLMEIPKKYDQSLHDQIMKIKKMTYKPPITINFLQYKNKQINIQTKDVLKNGAINDFRLGLDSGLKRMNQLLRYSQQLNITEKQLFDALVEGFNENRSLYGERKKLQEALMKDALDKKYITIIDKNGKPRNYNIKKYAELVSRTTFINSNTDAVINTALAYDSDLVQVSSHNTLTPYDAQFEGKIFSLSGRDKEFPPATDLPAFHPNCRHSITVFFKDAHTDEQIKKISDFSLGKTEIHPTRASHVPISERKFA